MVMHEISISTRINYSNPYTQVTLSCTFTSPTAGTVIVPGFWDGGANWKIRFTPPALGTWNYITSSNDADLNNLSGSITNNSGTGFVEVDPDNVWGWRTRDDALSHLWMSDTVWRGLQPSIYTYSQYMDVVNARSAQGFNHFREHLNSMDDGYAFFTDLSYTLPNINTMQEIDRRIVYANSHGIILDLCVGSGSRFPASMMLTNSTTNATRERYLKYLIGRYGAFNITWEGLSEYEENPDATNLINAIGNYLMNNDPYDHPRSTHTLSDNTSLRNSGWLSWIMYQSTGENPATILANRIYNKPQINEEYWYEANCQTGSAHDDTTNYQMRKGAWKIALSGGFFSTGNVATYTGGSNTYNSCGLNAPQISQMRYLYDFIYRTRFWDLVPNNSLVSSGIYCSALSGTEYVVYLPNGGPTNVNLSAATGTLIVEWLNTRTGTYQGATTVQGGATRPFSAPDSNDWILHIFKCTAPVVSISIGG